MAQLCKLLLEREGQQKPREELHACLHDAQFLDEVAPIAVQPLGWRLVALATVAVIVRVVA